MTTMRVSYPRYRSGEPRPMKTEAIWRIATEVRRQVAVHAGPAAAGCAGGDRAHPPARGQRCRLRRDLGHRRGTVHDEDGREVMGVCEHDADEPDQVMISLNQGDS